MKCNYAVAYHLHNRPDGTSLPLGRNDLLVQNQLRYQVFEHVDAPRQRLAEA